MRNGRLLVLWRACVFGRMHPIVVACLPNDEAGTAVVVGQYLFGRLGIAPTAFPFDTTLASALIAACTTVVDIVEQTGSFAAIRPRSCFIRVVAIAVFRQTHTVAAYPHITGCTECIGKHT